VQLQHVAAGQEFPGVDERREEHQPRDGACREAERRQPAPEHQQGNRDDDEEEGNEQLRLSPKPLVVGQFVLTGDPRADDIDLGLEVEERPAVRDGVEAHCEYQRDGTGDQRCRVLRDVDRTVSHSSLLLDEEVEDGVDQCDECHEDVRR
jgi:hypothetical protein